MYNAGMYNAGLSPERTSDPGRAFHLWSSDGAVILTTDRTDAAGMLASAHDVFGPRILVHQSSTLELHIDGCMAFGDYYPDLVFLLSERPAAAGGASFIVDGQRLLYAIASDPTQRALSRFLWDIKLEQSRPAGGGPGGAGKLVPSRRPVASRTCAGRLTVRRHQHQRLIDGATSRADHRQHLAAWAWLTEEAARTAPRFQLHRGDLLCLDNYRVFHGHEPCTGYGQGLHTLWAWSDMAFGLPRPSDLAAARRADVITQPSR
jgi:Taurine catabolism dioxygenase TauD, TfdA family